MLRNLGIRIFCKVTTFYSHILTYNNFFTSYIFLPLDPQVASLLRQASPFGMPSDTFRSKSHLTSLVTHCVLCSTHVEVMFNSCWTLIDLYPLIQTLYINITHPLGYMVICYNGFSFYDCVKQGPVSVSLS